jgi:hypothetical protein
MNHTDQNGLKASAYLLGISVEELIDVLNNASQIKEIHTTSGFPLSLPTRTSQTQPASKVGDAEHKGRRVDTPVPQEPSDANANEHQRDRVIRYTGKVEGSLLGSPHWEHPEGEWVKWEDYARLKAEVERLSKKEDYFHDLLNQYALDDMRLTAQVERLRKAGIAMGMCLPDTDEANKAYRDFEAGGLS